MKKNTLNMRSLLDKYQANCDRIAEIADACEKEQRERNDAETKEYNALMRENQLLEMRMRSLTADYAKVNDAKVDADKIIRENVAAGRQTEIRLVRDLVMVSDAEAGAIVPLNVKDILDPLVEGLILDKVGLPLPTGLAGDYVWPVYEAVEASIVGEGVALSDTQITMDKLTASPQRIGIAIAVTRETINQTNGIIETIVRKLMPQAVYMLLNKILFSTTKVANATSLVGPFYGKTPVSLSSTPTFQELNLMKAKVLESGVDGSALCWVMTKSEKAILEGTPINSNGIFKPMIENDMLCGLPVFTSNYIRNKAVEYYKASKSEGVVTWTKQDSAPAGDPDFEVSGDSSANALATIDASDVSANDIAQVTILTENIGLGDWRYQPMGLFGQISFIVDPYSQARKNAVDFVLNTNYGTKTLRPEAFALGQVSAVSNS